MIDEKKIKEGARDYINKNGYFVKYDEDPCVDIESAYKEGAHWAINEFLKDLWHPANEQPKHSKWIMTQFLDDDNDIAFEIDIAGPLIEWREYAKKYRIVKWLYVDDTLPR